MWIWCSAFVDFCCKSKLNWSWQMAVDCSFSNGCVFPVEPADATVGPLFRKYLKQAVTLIVRKQPGAGVSYSTEDIVSWHVYCTVMEKENLYSTDNNLVDRAYVVCCWLKKVWKNFLLLHKLCTQMQSKHKVHVYKLCNFTAASFFWLAIFFNLHFKWQKTPFF